MDYIDPDRGPRTPTLPGLPTETDSVHVPSTLRPTPRVSPSDTELKERTNEENTGKGGSSGTGVRSNSEGTRRRSDQRG